MFGYHHSYAANFNFNAFKPVLQLGCNVDLYLIKFIEVVLI